MRTDIFERRNEIEEWIVDGLPKASMARTLRCKVHTLDSYLNKMGIVYVGNQGGKKIKKSNYYISAMNYIKTTNPKASIARIKFIQEGIKKHQCEICLETKWMGQPIPLELDHIDGNRYNYAFNNLRIICPNCHSQTPTNSGKNRGRYMCA